MINSCTLTTYILMKRIRMKISHMLMNTFSLILCDSEERNCHKFSVHLVLILNHCFWPQRGTFIHIYQSFCSVGLLFKTLSSGCEHQRWHHVPNVWERRYQRRLAPPWQWPWKANRAHVWGWTVHGKYLFSISRGSGFSTCPKLQ